MLVKAAPGLKCPTEHNPKEYITDTVAVEVPDTTYYNRLVDDGSLVRAKPEKMKAGGEPQ